MRGPISAQVGYEALPGFVRDEKEYEIALLQGKAITETGDEGAEQGGVRARERHCRARCGKPEQAVCLMRRSSGDRGAGMGRGGRGQ